MWKFRMGLLTREELDQLAAEHADRVTLLRTHSFDGTWLPSVRRRGFTAIYSKSDLVLAID